MNEPLSHSRHVRAQAQSPSGFLLSDGMEHHGSLSAANPLPCLAGGPVGQTFLADFVDQTWKDTYISNFFSFAGPFGGAPFAVPVLVRAICCDPSCAPVL